MKICKGILNRTQIFQPDGSVRLCSWIIKELRTVGKLTENTMDEIWHGEKAKYLFDRLADGDYSVCNHIECCYLNAGQTPPTVEIEKIPEHLDHLYIGYDLVCNYRCTSCYATHGKIFDKSNTPEIVADRDKIEKNLAEVLPHLKFISAHGTGELFASKSTLKLLADWKPLAPKEEVSVFLETNGSLFDEKHWRQIENLGQYNLGVAVTVMSFDEHVYQILSGSRLPISKIEDNLRFIKSLREKGIINYLELATVVQERNFRTLPTFVERCIEEFGADSVRPRPYIGHHSGASDDEKWFTDVRNKQHPYYAEYSEMLKAPILKHPKVDDWGMFNIRDVESPYAKESNLRKYEHKILSTIMRDSSVLDKLKNLLHDGKVVIHGAGPVGLAICQNLIEGSEIRVECITDFKQEGEFHGIPIVNLNNSGCACFDKNTPMLITWLETSKRNLDYIRRLGYTGDFIQMDTIFDYKRA